MRFFFRSYAQPLTPLASRRLSERVRSCEACRAPRILPACAAQKEGTLVEPVVKGTPTPETAQRLKASAAPQIPFGMPPTKAVEDAEAVNYQICPRDFLCPECAQIFFHAGSLELHMKYTHRIREDPGMSQKDPADSTKQVGIEATTPTPTGPKPDSKEEPKNFEPPAILLMKKPVRSNGPSGTEEHRHHVELFSNPSSARGVNHDTAHRLVRGFGQREDRLTSSAAACSWQARGPMKRILALRRRPS